jgi:homoserine dehydrogenase
MGGRDPAGTSCAGRSSSASPSSRPTRSWCPRGSRAVRGGRGQPASTFMYEAAVAGAIPIIKPLKESLAGDRIRRVVGILNGTTNYILTRMTEEGADLRRRPRRGPGARLRRGRPDRGRRRHDAAAKTAILASLAFDTRVHGDDVFREGIERVTATDIEVANGSATSSSCSASPRGRRRRRGAGPPDVPAEDPPAGRGARVVQRDLRRGGRRRRADVLRPRGRVASPPVGDRRRHRRRGPQPAPDRPGPGRVPAPQQADPARSRSS